MSDPHRLMQELADADPGRWEKIARELAAQDAPIVPALHAAMLRAAARGMPGVVQRAVDVLVGVGSDEARAFLLWVISVDACGVGEYAFRALAGASDPHLADYLTAVWRDPREASPTVLLDLLVECGGLSAVPFLLGLVRDRGSTHRLAALTGLGRVGGETAVRTLGEILLSRVEWSVHMVAAAALGETRDPGAVTALWCAWEGEPPETTEARVQALVRIGPAAIPGLIGGLQTTEAAAVVAGEALRRLGVASVRPLCGALATAAPVGIVRIALLLQQLGDPSAGRALVRTFCEAPPAGQRQIAIALGTLGGSEAIGPLRTALSHLFPLVRGPAAVSLVRLGESGEELIDPLIDALRNDPAVRVSAAEALAELARRAPTRSLRHALSPLKRLASPWGFAAPEHRPVFGAARREIEHATSQLRDLPLPASKPLPAADALPRSAASSLPSEAEDGASTERGRGSGRRGSAGR